jgi:hypothetical protein
MKRFETVALLATPSRNNIWHRVFEKYALLAEATFIKEKEHVVCAETWVRLSYLYNK